MTKAQYTTIAEGYTLVTEGNRPQFLFIAGPFIRIMVN